MICSESERYLCFLSIWENMLLLLIMLCLNSKSGILKIFLSPNMSSKNHSTSDMLITEIYLYAQLKCIINLPPWQSWQVSGLGSKSHMQDVWFWSVWVLLVTILSLSFYLSHFTVNFQIKSKSQQIMKDIGVWEIHLLVSSEALTQILWLSMWWDGSLLSRDLRKKINSAMRGRP